MTSQSDTVVLIGSGGREHALAVALAQSPLVKEVIVCPGNGGTQAEGGKISNAVDSNGNLISKQDNDTVLELVKRVNAKMVVVGPRTTTCGWCCGHVGGRVPKCESFWTQ